MNPNLEALRPYPFEQLARLKAGTAPPARLQHIGLSIGEPRHGPPPFVLQALREHLSQLDSYPTTLGLAQLREACAAWSRRRYALREGGIDPQNGFYLWSALHEDDERFARELFAQQHLGRDAGRGNPGPRHVRISLVPGLDACVEAAERLRTFLMRRCALRAGT